jgi:hypothetical protein
MVDCPGNTDNEGCNGGFMTWSFQVSFCAMSKRIGSQLSLQLDLPFGCHSKCRVIHLTFEQAVMQEGGLDTESCYPYQAQTGNSCLFNPKPPCCGSTITSYVNVTSGSEAALQAAVYLAPTSAAVEADATSFEFYSGGVYNDASCGQEIEHGIAVVGYGYNATAKLDYWILKNSWGTQWGSEGTILCCHELKPFKGTCTLQEIKGICVELPRIQVMQLDAMIARSEQRKQLTSKILEQHNTL